MSSSKNELHMFRKAPSFLFHSRPDNIGGFPDIYLARNVHPPPWDLYQMLDGDLVLVSGPMRDGEEQRAKGNTIV